MVLARPAPQSIALWPEVTPENHGIVWVERGLWISLSPTSRNAGLSGTCPGVFGMYPERENPHLPWPSVALLCHPQLKVLPYVEVKLF